MTTHSTGDTTLTIFHKTIQLNGVDLFYRESGPADSPVILLLHGFPSSSFMFRNLIPLLNNKYRLIAPDYPGFGHSSVPAAKKFNYSFEQIASVIESFVDILGLRKFSMYIQDYGAPVGLRLVTKRPELLQCLIIQNGNAYEEGLADSWAPLKAIWNDPDHPQKKKAVYDFMKLDGTKLQYTAGVDDPSKISPDTYTFDQYLLERPGVKEIQYQLFYDYRTNVRDYPLFHKMFREYQPPALVVWGEKDIFFTKEGALAYAGDLKNIEFNFYNTGHFALEEYPKDIAEKIDLFLQKNLGQLQKD
ncbi:alpha/beta hydrolase [Lacibacter sediminis]|uniref:Alpha/beta hydrolase n=2 Tax=Lacibacter sediminis TaxID=2760713 RepID=A0A7G5XMV5_9BACT|nr:alpha/beta hydrolase [Lacibacter sediminis]